MTFRKIAVFAISIAVYVAGANYTLGPTLIPTTIPWGLAAVLTLPFFIALVIAMFAAEVMQVSAILILPFASWLGAAAYLLMKGPLPFFELTEAPEWLWSVGLLHGFAVGEYF